MYRKRKDYVVNKYWTNALGKNHKKHLSIAIMEKESQGIAKNNDSTPNEYIDSNYNKILRYTSVEYIKQLRKKAKDNQPKSNKKKRTWYR